MSTQNSPRVGSTAIHQLLQIMGEIQMRGGVLVTVRGHHKHGFQRSV